MSARQAGDIIQKKFILQEKKLIGFYSLLYDHLVFSEGWHSVFGVGVRFWLFKFLLLTLKTLFTRTVDFNKINN